MSEEQEAPGEEAGGNAPPTGFVATPIERLDAALEHYEILGELGEGGMAIVYRARDLRHDRHVAIKVLKPNLAAVIGAERFEAEIRTTANLQHPNILPLFDSGEADGFLYYVMPFVDGVTLQRRIDTEKQLPVDEAIRIVSEVADGLDHAHGQGIVHRDIKPANILIRDGRPVITDFGIAIAVGAAGARLTETGLSLGTPFYMSPEQASGDRNIGPASDTYSLAAVLYEALTGEPPFLGGTPQAVMSRIVSGVTVAARSVRTTIPVHVDHAIQKALQKVPADRFETTGDFARALHDPGFRYAAATGPDAAAGTNATGGAADAAARWNPLTVVTTLLSVLLALALWLALSGEGRTVVGESVHFTLLPIPGAEFVGIESPGVSQDGRLIAFPARLGDTTRIQIRSLDDFAARWVDGTDDGFAPFFSPDGRWLGFFTTHEIRKVPIEGGPPTTIARVPFLMNASAVWLPSDTIVFHQANDPGLGAVHADGGAWWRLTYPDTAAGEVRHAVPRALPDGRILFTVRPWSDLRMRWDDGQSPAIVTPGTGEVVRIDVPGSAWAWLPGDRLLTWNSGAFVAWPFDLRTTSVGGPSARVPTGLRGGDSCDDLRVSTSGTAVCSDQRSAGARTLALLDREGTAEPISTVAAEFRWPRLSPDGRSVATLANNRFGVIDLASGRVVELAPSPVGEPTWTPDSRSVVYWAQSATGDADLWVRDRDATTPARQLTDDPDRPDWPTSVSPDGALVLFYDTSDLWTVPLEGGEPSRVTDTPGAWERDGVFSPGGDLVAYSSDEPGSWEVFVTEWPLVPGRTRVSFEGGHSPKWSPDGNELYYVRGTRMMAAEIRRDPVRVGESRELFRSGFWVDPSGDQTYDVAPDGRFLVIQGDDVVDVRVVTGLGSASDGAGGR